MMKRKRITAALLSALMLVPVLAACSESGDTPAGDTTAPSAVTAAPETTVSADASTTYNVASAFASQRSVWEANIQKILENYSDVEETPAT